MPLSHLPSPAVRKTLRQLGANIREARLKRRLPMSVVAERAATSRPTLSRLEKGDPAVSIGIYAATLQALGLLGDLLALADPGKDAVGQELAAAALPKRARINKSHSDRHEGG
jgi:transcriptional regulator with XRE-family HTH domain